MEIDLHTFLYTCFALFGILCIGISIQCSSQSRSPQEYLLAGRNVSSIILSMTLIATQIGGGYILGTSELATQIGLWAFLYPAGSALGLFVLSFGYGARLRNLKMTTISDLFEKHYMSSTLKKVCGILSIVSLTGMLAAQAIALKKIFFFISPDNNLGYILTWMTVVYYTARGGFKTVIITDTIQAVALITILTATFILTLYSTNVMSLNALLKENFLSSSSIPFNSFSFFLMPFLLMFIEQDTAQRCFSAKSGIDISYGAFRASVFLIIFSIIPIYFGIQGQYFNNSFNASSFFLVLARLNTPWITLFASASILLAIISTQSSVLCAITSNLVHDFVNKEQSKVLNPKKAKLWTIITGLIALGISYTKQDIVPTLIQIYQIPISCLFIPVVIGVLRESNKSCKGNRYAATLALLIGGMTSLIINCLCKFPLQEIIPLFLSGTAFFIGEAWVTTWSIVKKTKEGH